MRRLLLASVVVLTLAGCASGDDVVERGATAPATSDSTSLPTSPPTSPPGSPPTSWPTSWPTSPPTSAAAIDPDLVLDRVRAHYPAPGGLASVRVDGVDRFGSSGAADLTGTPITPDTRFRIASITKPIVATLVLDAVERGELSLDDLVADLLPGVIRPEPPITVRVLLNHTSGVFDEGNEGDVLAELALLADPVLREEADALIATYAAGEGGIASDRLIVALAETHDRYFAPGTGFHYSNPNYQLAAMVLESVTGETLAALLADRIVEPLGLEHTTIAPPDVSSPELRGYGTSVDDGSLVDVTDDLISFGNGGNGGVVASAGDLLTIVRAINAGDLVAPDLLEEMRTPSAAGVRAGSRYGLGLVTYSLTCGTFYGHEGGVNGTASIAVASADGADGAVVALNLRDGSDPRLPAVADELLCGSS